MLPRLVIRLFMHFVNESLNMHYMIFAELVQARVAILSTKIVSHQPELPGPLSTVIQNHLTGTNKFICIV